MHRLLVELAGEVVAPQPGRPFTLGRGGDLVVDDSAHLDPTLLTLTFDGGFWWLSNTGREVNAHLSDPRGLSRVTLAPGARAPLMLGRTVVAFTAGPYRYEVNMDLARPVMELVPARASAAPSSAPGRGTSFTQSQLLAILAIAEPLLGRSGTGVWAVPSAVQAARRLGWPQTKFNRKVDNVCDKLDRMGVEGVKGRPGRQALGRRARLAEYALEARLVTAADLPRLDEEHARSLDAR